MKTIGLIGGMSWESSAEYYRIINEEIKKKLGGYIRQSVFCTVLILKRLNTFNQKELGIKLVKPWGKQRRSLEKAGADFIVICTNTMHKVISYIQAMITIPILHIADATVKPNEQTRYSFSRITRYQIYNGAKFL